ncbi:MAG: DNA cytosine methyltransferase [Candidatus Cloacimonadota bacterium]|nr:DNA cytosine methyltransferase [Candidatus Cloacimonadota bacterium]
MKQIPVIDLFAGPGGLAEGFSSVLNAKKRVFKIKLSIEKDENAHKTLLLRSFCRQFPVDSLPPEYYNVIEAKTVKEREELTRILYSKYTKQANGAKKEAWNCELGSEKFPIEQVDKRIRKELKGRKDWVLIGGPPCQAYSMAGRSRVGGIDPDDHRVFLYKEYLRIIAEHHPAVFVMENVKGLLSAKVNDEKVFDWIKHDLQEPCKVFRNSDPVKYKIYSLSSEFITNDQSGGPIYKDDRDYLIRSEEYGIPQKRHRVILLGVREDLDIKPDILTKHGKLQKLKDIIGNLPRLRSGISKEYIGHKWVLNNGIKKKKRLYRKMEDTDKNWASVFNEHIKELCTWNDLAKGSCDDNSEQILNSGSEFVEYTERIDPANSLANWFEDEKLKGVSNHETRTHLKQDLKRYLFSAVYAKKHGSFPRMADYEKHNKELLPDHESATSGKFADRFRVQMPDIPATTITSHISKDGHYFIHYDETQCRSFTVREAARVQTFPDNYIFCGTRTAQYHQIGNAVPPYLAYQIGKIVKQIFSKIKDK